MSFFDEEWAAASPSRSVERARPAAAAIVGDATEQANANNDDDNNVRINRFLRKMKTSDDVLLVLKKEPTTKQLFDALTVLVEGRNDFNIKAASAKGAQIINVLVTTIIPDYWATITATHASEKASQIRELLVQVLRSVAGIGALVTSLKVTDKARTNEQKALLAKDKIECLAQVLAPKDLVFVVLEDVTKFNSETQQHVLWQEFISSIAGGRLLSTTSEVIHATKCLDPDRDEDAWVADGRKYASWVGKNINSALLKLSPSDRKYWLMIAQMAKRSISLAHPDLFVAQIVDGLIMGEKAMSSSLQLLMTQFNRADRERFFRLILGYSMRTYLSEKARLEASDTDGKLRIGGVAAIISSLVSSDIQLKPEERLGEYLVNWMCSNDADLASFSIEARRAMIAALADKQDSLHTLLDKSLKSFGDKLHIQHTSLRQQEALAQTILLTIGYLYRLDSSNIRGLSRSSMYLSAVSNRLASSIPRARVLGMIVGTAISRLCESPDKVMNFDVEEQETLESKAFMDLVYVEDKVGSVQDLKMTTSSPSSAVLPKKRNETKMAKSRPKQHPPLPPDSSKKIIAIEEISSSDTEGSDDLTPYAKPDGDPSDSDDDPTLINRSKPTAPVYIRDLISLLQSSSDNPDFVTLALRTAPSLIRRKASFGTELLENIDRLSSALINLASDVLSEPQNRADHFQSMIACITAQPAKMAPWFTEMWFQGDLSQEQRAGILTALGLAAREVGGFEDELISERKEEDFPSQKLPSHMAAVYSEAQASEPLTKVANRITSSTLRPMALEAADSLTGPNALKVRTFSSRMSVEKSRAAKQKQRSTRVPKDLHKLLSESFSLELCGRLQLILSSSSRHLASTSLLDPPLLRLATHTLIIYLDTLGPNAIQLPVVTRETLLLLTTLHNLPLSRDATVLPPVLNLLLLILDLNISAGSVAEERLITEFGSMISELVSWIVGLEGSIPDDAYGRGQSEGEEMMPWTVIAAGVRVKWAETGRKFQGRMLGLGLGMDGDF